ncbi:MAG: hypothetical protein ACXW1E_09040, partial [Halobacteriota archaeon]
MLFVAARSPANNVRPAHVLLPAWFYACRIHRKFYAFLFLLDHVQGGTITMTLERKIVYFDAPGEENTTTVL